MTTPASYEIREGSLDDPRVQVLLTEHLKNMASQSPPESMHALDVTGLRRPSVTFWTVWQGDDLAGCGALQALEPGHGELKSMRTAASHRRRGVASLLVEHSIRVARARGYRRLSLETGTIDAFAPAHALYARHGFVECGPFAEYRRDPFSRYMTRALVRTPNDSPQTNPIERADGTGRSWTVVRPYVESDWPAAWAVLEPVFRAGETYGFDRAITGPQARDIWAVAPPAVFVAVDPQERVLGTYFLKPNHRGPGGHVCNCGYVVSAAARGQGVATAMCEHSQDEARRLGYRAMQFNLVAASNTGAVRLWKSLGFAVVGTLPGAFDHPHQGYVDAFVMFKTLV